MSYLTSTDIRDRLAGLMEADAIFTADPPPFPHPINKIDPTSVSAETDIDICLIPSGFRLEEGSLGGRGVGTATIIYQVALLLYVYSDQTAGPSQGRGDLRDQLTMQAIEALFHYEVDPTPGSQYWYAMRFAPRENLTTLNHSLPGWRASETRIELWTRQRKT